MSRETKLAILSAALDLKRVTTGYQNGSEKMSNRFAEEAIRYLKEIRQNQVKPYIFDIAKTLPAKLVAKNNDERAETALTYSLILQNYALAK